MPDLLVELLSEEIPARMQSAAAADLKRLVTDGLVAAGLTYAGAAAFATPRRLALSLEGLSAASRDVREERKGPAVGAPQAALDGFLRATGLREDQLERRPGPKGEVWFAVTTRPGGESDAACTYRRWAQADCREPIAGPAAERAAGVSAGNSNAPHDLRGHHRNRPHVGRETGVLP